MYDCFWKIFKFLIVFECGDLFVCQRVDVSRLLFGIRSKKVGIQTMSYYDVQGQIRQ